LVPHPSRIALQVLSLGNRDTIARRFGNRISHKQQLLLTPGRFAITSLGDATNHA